MVDGWKQYLKSLVGTRMLVPMHSISSRLTYAAHWLRKQHAGQNRLYHVSTVTFVTFVFMAFFIRGLHGVAVSPVVLVALLTLQNGVAAEIIRKNAWFWLFTAFLGAWMGLGAIIGSPGYQASDFLNLALLGAFFLFMGQISRTLSTKQILLIIAVIGGASAVASIGLHVLSARHIFERMFPLGRGGNPIPAAGGFAVALIALATLWLDRAVDRRLMPLSLVVGIPLLLALAWTQSRGPVIALGLALPMAFWLSGRRGIAAVLAGCLFTWLVVAGLVFFEPSIKAMFCGSEADWCRPAHRVEIWSWVGDQIALHPLLGSGPSFRFAREWMSHPHNGLLGIAMFYGVVILAAFGVLIAFYARRLIQQPDGALRFFGLACLIFSFGYMGTDLSNPFAFFNMHYLFLWLPFFLNLSSSPAVSLDEEGLALSRPDGLRHI